MRWLTIQPHAVVWQVRSGGMKSGPSSEALAPPSGGDPIVEDLGSKAFLTPGSTCVPL